MNESILIFLEETHKRIRKLTKKIKERNQESVAWLTHTIRSSTATFSGNKLHAIALEIETACNAANWREAESILPRLNREFESLERAMREFLKTLT